MKSFISILYRSHGGGYHLAGFPPTPSCFFFFPSNVLLYFPHIPRRGWEQEGQSISMYWAAAIAARGSFCYWLVTFPLSCAPYSKEASAADPAVFGQGTLISTCCLQDQGSWCSLAPRKCGCKRGMVIVNSGKPSKCLQSMLVIQYRSIYVVAVNVVLCQDTHTYQTVIYVT